MAISKDEILDAISSMTLIEVTELISAMETKFGVTAAAPVAAAAAGPAAAAAPVEEQTEFKVILKEYPADKKVTVIKLLVEVVEKGPQAIACGCASQWMWVVRVPAHACMHGGPRHARTTHSSSLGRPSASV